MTHILLQGQGPYNPTKMTEAHACRRFLIHRAFAHVGTPCCPHVARALIDISFYDIIERLLVNILLVCTGQMLF